MSVHLQWFGLATFRLWEEGGLSLAMDPYSPPVVANACGISDPAVLDFKIEADTVICSSLTDEAHSYVQAVEGYGQVINALDVAQGTIQPEINNELIYAVQAAEAPHHPEGPDDNALYAFKAGGLWILHMGDLGYGIGADELAPFAGHCDVLLALVGEHLTLRLEDLDPMIDILEPTWILPMHYNCPPITAGMTKLNGFLERRPQDPVVFVRNHTVTLPLPRVECSRPTIVVLEPAGYEATETF